MEEQNKYICSKEIEYFIQDPPTFNNSTKNFIKIFNSDATSNKNMNLLLFPANESEKHADSFVNQLLNIQEQYIPCYAPRRSLNNQRTLNRKRNLQELPSDDEVSLYEPSSGFTSNDEISFSEPSLSPPRKTTKAKAKKLKEVKKTLAVNKKKRKSLNLRGPYTTVSPSLRSVVFQILHEQAQIWYDLNFKDQIDGDLRKKRESQLITNEKVKDDALSFILYEKSHGIISDQCDIFDNPIKYKEKDIFVKSYYDMDTHASLHNLSPALDVYDFCVKDPDELAGEVPFEEDETVMEFGKELKKDENMIIDIPLKPLKISLTIGKQDIFKYLKHNESTVNIKNKTTCSETQISILKKLSQLTGISEKTLQRFAIMGSERKKGAGRKTLDFAMEKELTKYVIELSKRGRPPTRKEVIILAKLLSTVRDFKASKGWLDKYLNRVKNYLKQDPNNGGYFRLLDCSKLKSYEDKKMILDYLKEIGASDEFIKKFKELRNQGV